MAGHHNKGHRQRTRESLLSKGAETLPELEILEMLLFAGQPSGDTKPLAKSLMRQFGSLAAVLRAPVQRLTKQRGLDDASICALKLRDAANLNLAHSDIHNCPVLNSWGVVKHYCINRLAHAPIEYLIMLCLDNHNRLIAEETLSKGIVDQTPVCVREVINTVLKHHTQAVILAHNHPSGETTPSPADIEMTEELQRALSLVTVDLHDQLIVAVTQCLSFKSTGYL